MKFEIYTYSPHIYDLCDQVQLIETCTDIQKVREHIEYEAQILTEEYDDVMIHNEMTKKFTETDLGNWVRNLPNHLGEDTWILYQFPNSDELTIGETYMLMESRNGNTWVMIIP